MDQRAVTQAAELLVAARRTGRLLDALPDACKPQTLEDAHAIQDATLAALGETVAGWKAAIVDGRVVRGAIVASRVFESGARVAAATMPLLGIEAEIAFRFERDLPAGKHSYEDVAAAVSAFAAIEIVDSRFRSHTAVSAQERNADFVTNGGFVRGPSAAAWRSLDLVNISCDADDRRRGDRETQRRPRGGRSAAARGRAGERSAGRHQGRAVHYHRHLHRHDVREGGADGGRGVRGVWGGGGGVRVDCPVQSSRPNPFLSCAVIPR